MLPDHTYPDIARLPTIIHKLQPENYHLCDHNQILTDALKEPDLHNQYQHADCVFIKQYLIQLLTISLPDMSQSVWLSPKVTLFCIDNHLWSSIKMAKKRFIYSGCYL